MRHRRARVWICAALSAAVLGGGILASEPGDRIAEEVRIPTSPSSTVPRNDGTGRESASPVIARSEAARQSVSPDAEIRVLETVEYRVTERLAVGILPEKAENNAVETAEPEPARRYLGSYKITGYCICVQCCGKSDGVTASGTIAEVGRTCAAPPDIPFGTRLWIDGIGERIVEDRGGLGMSKIDVLCADHPACYAITTEGKVDVWIMEG